MIIIITMIIINRMLRRKRPLLLAYQQATKPLELLRQAAALSDLVLQVTSDHEVEATEGVTQQQVLTLSLELLRMEAAT